MIEKRVRNASDLLPVNTIEGFGPCCAPGCARILQDKLPDYPAFSGSCTKVADAAKFGSAPLLQP